MHSMKCSRFLVPAVCALLSPALSFPQNSASFNTVVSNAQPDNPGNIYSVDVNNDGLTDIVSDGGYSPAAFYVSLNQGDGTFAAPVQYLLPGSDAEPMCIAAADYNKDGNVDLAVPLAGTNQIAVYLGNGDGTFQSPIVSTINLPSGATFIGDGGCAAADFNADGAIDLAAPVYSELYVFQGAGNGRFSASPYPVLAAQQSDGTQVFVGDYNGDGKADITTSTPTGGGTTVYVLYGNGSFAFSSTAPYTANGYLTIGSGDVNSDGITDLYALTNYNGGQQLGVFYGTNTDTFTSYWIDAPSAYDIGGNPAARPWQAPLTLGDYNSDGRIDLATSAVNTGGTAEYVELFLAGAAPGAFTTQVVALPSDTPWLTSPVAGLLSGSYLKPDVTLNQSNTGSDDTTPTTLDALLNTTNGYFSICPYPHSGKGFHVCAAGLAYGDTALFSAAANSLGKLRKIELWVDGSKVQEQDHTWDTHAYFDWAGTFARGTHQAAFYAYDIDNTVQRYDFSFNVGARHE